MHPLLGTLSGCPPSGGGPPAGLAALLPMTMLQGGQAAQESPR